MRFGCLTLAVIILVPEKKKTFFSIQTPVAITIGIRKGAGSKNTAAKIRYKKIVGDSRDEKLEQLANSKGLDDIEWSDCPNDWQSAFLPFGEGVFFKWPRFTDIFPYSHSGLQFKRTWTVGETKEVLMSRWDNLRGEKDPEKREAKFKSTDAKSFDSIKPGVESLSISTRESVIGIIGRYGYQSFTRCFAFLDERFADRFRPELWNINGDSQIYFVTTPTEPIGTGQALSVSAIYPDICYFRGQGGGKNIFPLYRDRDSLIPNLTNGLLDTLGGTLKTKPSESEFAAYVYAILCGQSYTKSFWDELEISSPRVPITKEDTLFTQAVKFGQRLIWLHTYAERFQSKGQGDEVPEGKAKNIKGISSDPMKYPEKYTYNEETKEICIGDGKFGPVEPDVWEFEVSSLKVVKSWIGYRMKKTPGKKSSTLDDIGQSYWTAAMTKELLELLWVLEATLAMEPKLSDLLDKIRKGECFTTDELPKPTEKERKALKTKSVTGEVGEQMDNGI